MIRESAVAGLPDPRPAANQDDDLTTIHTDECMNNLETQRRNAPTPCI